MADPLDVVRDPVAGLAAEDPDLAAQQRDRGVADRDRQPRRDREVAAVRGGQIDVESGSDLRSARDHEDVVVGQVERRLGAVEELHVCNSLRGGQPDSALSRDRLRSEM